MCTGRRFFCACLLCDRATTLDLLYGDAEYDCWFGVIVLVAALTVDVVVSCIIPADGEERST